MRQSQASAVRGMKTAYVSISVEAGLHNCRSHVFLRVHCICIVQWETHQNINKPCEKDQDHVVTRNVRLPLARAQPAWGRAWTCQACLALVASIGDQALVQ